MAGKKTPDQILKEIEKESKQKNRGKLKIFFGHAAGVGKTYAMLDAAKGDMENGVDVVAGYIEPHDRVDTIALLKGFETLSPQIIKYKGIELKEFNLDAALFRKPQLILVDELAHTNAQGCRHSKRYQDVKELLEAGIDVYTTVNVQHLESLNDIVASITHVTVRERIPDSVFDGADQVELVDIEPTQLIKRLEEGKIYKKNQAGRAAENFFLVENLTALREIALRRTAARVNKKVMEDRAGRSGADYFTGEHIVICISPSPTNMKVIRTAARMANAFQAEFTALFVETPEYEQVDEKIKQAVYDNIQLAKQFGARASIVYGDNIAYQIAEYAKANGISKVVLGRTGLAGRRLFFKQSLIEKLTAYAPNLDLYVIPDANAVRRAEKKAEKKLYQNWEDVLQAAVVLGICTISGFAVYNAGLGNISIAMLYIAGAMLTAWITKGKLWAIIASVLNVIVYNLFFTEPRFTLQATEPIYPFTFLMMGAASLLVSFLTLKLKIQGRQEALKSRRMEILLNTSWKLRRAMGADAILKEGAVQAAALLGKSIIIYNAIEGNMKREEMVFPKEMPVMKRKDDITAMMTEEEYAVAAWVMKSKHKAGRTTDTLPSAQGYYLPVMGEERVFAVYGAALREGEKINPFEKNILKAIINETAFAAEKYVILSEQNKES